MQHVLGIDVIPIVSCPGKRGQAAIDVMMTHVAYCLERYMRALTVTQFIPSCGTEQSRAEQSRMIGVKRPLKLGNQKPPKSAKKKKVLKETKPLADPDDSTVIANPYAEYMEQKPSELMEEIVVKPHWSTIFPSGEEYLNYQKPNLLTEQSPDSGVYEPDASDLASCSIEPAVTEVLEEGEIPRADEMVKNLNYVKGNVLEFPPKLPHIMGFRYKLLLEKANPKELIPGQPPSLTWLEDKYGHLIEKDFWYDRIVKLANLYMETCEGDVFDMAQCDLEKAVGHLVPYTEEEQEYIRLMKNYEQSPVQIDGMPTLEFLRKHHSKPLSAKDKARMLRAERVPPNNTHAQITKELFDEALTRYVPDECCPIHEDVAMRCLNADDPCGALFFKCSKPDCSVFYTSNTSEDVRCQLDQEIHPTVHQGLFDGTLKCHCDFSPRMKLSQSEKNPGRVYLTCFKKSNPCCYFQWVHWKVRPVEGPMDAFVEKRSKPYSRPENNRRPPIQPLGTWHRPAYVKYQRTCPPDTQQQLRDKSSQQLVRTGLDRFKKDNVKMYPAGDPWERPSPFKNDPWWTQKQTEQAKLTNAIDPNGGFKPSPLFGQTNQFKGGVYVGENSFAHEFFDTPSSSTFEGSGARLF